MSISNHKNVDKLLLTRVYRNGCRDSLLVIYLKYKPMVCDFLRKKGADDVTEDICQSVFLHISDGKCNYDGNSDVKSYLFGIAKYQFYGYTRQVKLENLACSPKTVPVKVRV